MRCAAAAMMRAGVDPGMLDEVIWWRTDVLTARTSEVAVDHSGVRERSR